MEFIIIFGPQAVGKMTVGQQLAARTGFKLFHNHMSIDLVLQFFEYHTPAGQRLIKLIRQEIFEEASQSRMAGFIFTCVWAFDLQSDWDYIAEVTALFESRGAEVYYVELEANIEERKVRNATKNRLQHKPSKRDLVWSEQDLVSSHEQYRLNSLPGEITAGNYIRMDNTNLRADQVAEMIVERFGLRRNL